MAVKNILKDNAGYAVINQNKKAVLQNHFSFGFLRLKNPFNSFGRLAKFIEHYILLLFALIAELEQGIALFIMS